MTKLHGLPLLKRQHNKEAEAIDSLHLKFHKPLPSLTTTQPNPVPPDSAVMVSPPSPSSSHPHSSLHSVVQDTTDAPSLSPQAEKDISTQRSYASAQAILQDYIPVIQKFINRERRAPRWTRRGPRTDARPHRSKLLGTDWSDYKILQSSVYFQQYRHPSKLTSRIILDSMCHCWGLYLTPNPEMHQEQGSCDIQLALDASFELVPDADWGSAELEPVARLMFGSVLLARFLVLQLFVEGLTSGNIQQRRAKWVIAQRAPYKAFRGLDIFALLSQDLCAVLTEDQIVSACHQIWRSTLSPLLRRFSDGSHVALSVVLDSADQAIPQNAPEAKRPLAMRAGFSCWTTILPPNSGVEFKVVCDKLIYLFIPYSLQRLSREMQDGWESLPRVSGSHQFRKRRNKNPVIEHKSTD
ncbi:hypothetical protein DL96DRAFT_1609814 [Flagelloscypha sp. PMI_526]|nr:hypothetical protein DL96DRAFT_1609814 [Flagelloscypha sp. PMI_526]